MIACTGRNGERLTRARLTLSWIAIPLLQLYTSGTTGNLKGVVLSQYNLMSTIMLGSMTAACRPNVVLPALV